MVVAKRRKRGGAKTLALKASTSGLNRLCVHRPSPQSPKSDHTRIHQKLHKHGGATTSKESQSQ
eukprot:3201517-Amphidinium_carterae.1